MRPLRTFAIVALLAAAGAGLAACSSPTTSSGGSGTHLVVALAEAPDDLDPTTGATFVGRTVFANMCEKLYDTSSDLSIVPQLASAMPTISNGGKTYTIKLRSGVKFNDGTPFNAQAVVTTLKRDKSDPKSARASELTAISSVTAVDDSTVKISLSTPFAPLTAVLADRSGMVESPTQLKKVGAAGFAEHPICVGPFTVTSRPSSDRIELAKSNDYYDKAKVTLSKITFEVVTQPNVRAANLRSGDVQVAERLAPTDEKSLQSSKNVDLKQVTSLGYDGISINVSNSSGAGQTPYNVVSTPLAKSTALRKAFALSLDRDTLNQVVNQGKFVVDCTPISQASPYAPGITCPKQNIAAAKKLVTNSGVSTPVPVTLVVQAADNQAVKFGEVVQSMAKKAGFAVKIQPTEFTTALTQAQAGKFDAFNIGWSGRLDPDQNISQFWGPGSTLNYTGAHYNDIDSLISQARATTDMSARKSIYKQICEKILADNNIVYLDHPTYLLGTTTSVHGVEYYGDGLVRLGTASLS